VRALPNVIEGIDVVVAELAGVALEELASLSPAEQARAARFRRRSDRERYAASHVLLRKLLQDRPACTASPFSISRSGSLAAYAFSHGPCVGIDVEAIRAVPEADAIAERHFPAAERAAYARLAPRQRPQAFFVGWTRTEALAKALGEGLSLPPQALDAALADGWRVLSFEPAPGYAGALACAPREGRQ
jgi:4'-phosphopantetheinyl transferase